MVVGFYYRAAVGLKKSIYMTIAEKIDLAKSNKTFTIFFKKKFVFETPTVFYHPERRIFK